ncbi:MAG: hypothetical protein AAGH19_09485 [Pseudomonadota bacterium]
METLARLTSWAFVFGALATLVFTSMRPVWKDIMGMEVSVEQVQGTVGDAKLTDATAAVPVPPQGDCDPNAASAHAGACLERTP